jgi:hypothetical protein
MITTGMILGISPSGNLLANKDLKPLSGDV